MNPIDFLQLITFVDYPYEAVDWKLSSHTSPEKAAIQILTLPNDSQIRWRSQWEVIIAMYIYISSGCTNTSDPTMWVISILLLLMLQNFHIPWNTTDTLPGLVRTLDYEQIIK